MPWEDGKFTFPFGGSQGNACSHLKEQHGSKVK
jgi:hypothetical protein